MVNFVTLVVIAVTTLTASASPTAENERRQSIGLPIVGGFATPYLQLNGVRGACGDTNLDTTLYVAEQALRFMAADCGRRVRVTNTQNGKSVVATVADSCDDCQGNANSLDLSVYALAQIAEEAQGIVPITWEYLS